MEELFKGFAEVAALALEATVVVIVVVGGLFAIVGVIREILFHTVPLVRGVRDVWLRYAAWILIALEFALAADIVRSAIAPTWDDIGQLGVIAVIRIALGYFLDRDIESITSLGETSSETQAET